MFDLNRYTVDRLHAAGVTADALDRCTYAEEDLFYSYRRTTHRKEAGLRSADFGDCSGEDLMALHFERSEFDARRDRLMIEMAERKLDAMLLFAQESMYWLTGYDTFGFCFFQSLVVKADGSMVLLTRSADLRQARQTSTIDNIVLWTDRDGANPAVDLRNLLNDLDLLGARIGVEYDTHGLTAFNGRRLDEQLQTFGQISDASGIVSRLRLFKSPAEIKKAEKAASSGRRRAGRRAAADQAGRRRSGDPCRHAGRDLRRRRRLSGQRIHHRLRPGRPALPLQGRPAQADQERSADAGMGRCLPPLSCRHDANGPDRQGLEAPSGTVRCGAAPPCWPSRRR